MTDKHPKRPRVPNQLAKSIIDIATGQTAEPAETGLTTGALGQISSIWTRWQARFRSALS